MQDGTCEVTATHLNMLHFIITADILLERKK